MTCLLRKPLLCPPGGRLCKCLVVSAFILGLSCVLTLSGVSAVATHLKSLAKRVRLNEGHVKAAKVYKVRVTALVSERAKLRGRVQNMTDEDVKLKSDLRHTLKARARAESKEEKARDSIKVAEVELREVRDELQVVQDDLLEARDGLQATQTELQVVKDELHSS